MNNFDYNVPCRGFWWTPLSADKQIPGELSVDDGTLILTVTDNGLYQKTFASLNRRPYMIPIFHGYTRNVETKKDIAFTLLDCELIKSQRSGLGEYTFRCRYGITKAHFTARSDIQIRAAFNKFQFLNEWINKSGIKIDRIPDRKGFHYKYYYEQPASITLAKSKLVHLYVYFRPRHENTTNRSTISESVYVNVEYSRTRTLHSFVDLFEKLRDFFSFAISLPLRAEQIGFFRYSARETKKSDGTRFQHEYDLFISSGKYFSKRKSYSGHEMLLSYDDIKGKEQLVYSRWLQIHQQFEPVLKLYFDTVTNPDLYTQNAFLNYVICLETYHRIRHSDFEGRDLNRLKKFEAYLEGLSNKNHRRAILTALEKKTDKSFSNRILDLLRTHAPITLLLVRRPSAFSKQVGRVRNYLMHFDERLAKRPIKESDLYFITNQLRVFMQALILIELGFSNVEAIKMLSRPPHNHAFLVNSTVATKKSNKSRD